MNPILSLLAVSFIPVIASIVLHFYFKAERFNDMPYMKKQIIIGIIFGIISILGTELGIPINGAIINIRDTGPLCAAIIFGGPSGIIAGIIGGIERWFAVYWGGGYYTRLACTISTIAIGYISAYVKKYLYDDRMIEGRHAFILGVVCEVLHMLMIFVTNINDIKRAFEFIELCTVPMVLVNSLTLTFSVYFINTLEKTKRDNERKHIPHLSTLFQNLLIWVVLLGLVFTTIFSYIIQNRLSQKETEDLLRLNIEDVVNDLKEQSDESLLSINKLVVDVIEKHPEIPLEEIAERYNVSEINIINERGIITDSNEEKNIGFDMASGEQSSEFLCLLNDQRHFVQEFRPITRDESVLRKYSGYVMGNGFVQVGYGEKEFDRDMKTRISAIVKHRHIGETGNMLIVDGSGRVISSSLSSQESSEKYNIQMNPNDTQDKTVYTLTINSKEYYYMFTTAERYKIYAILPKTEADFSQNLTAYLNQFMQIILSGTLFAAIYFVIKKLVVDNIRSVNQSLSQITGGQLDTVVDVSSSKEFISLSDGINTTVDSLKHFIEEANTRIDNELKYAAQIQESALPSTFPAFPERNEFDIYALMDPAKEVGGDFYDFYMLNKNTLVFLVADVAGKGIPASLFMMRAKTTLKTYAENNVTVADIFTNANYQLCEGNDAGMFVTAWMGFLNLETGELKYANAGHNKPLIRRKDGLFEYLEGPAGFVLAGMEGIVYKEQSTMLEPGDEIFLYTDGVVEATNVDKQLYGDDRLQICANKNIGADSMTLCNIIKEDVDKFYEGADQFDDITELSMQFKKYTTKNN